MMIGADFTDKRAADVQSAERDRLDRIAAEGGLASAMTYRQWLIGQALASASFASSSDSVVDAKNAISVADAVIAAIAKETTK